MRTAVVAATAAALLLAAPAQAQHARQRVANPGAAGVIVDPPPAIAGPARASELPRQAHVAQVCGCAVYWVNVFVGVPSYRQQVMRRMERRGIGPERRRRTKAAIYDWQRERRPRRSVCNRSPMWRKACNAAVACIGAAGTTLAIDETTDYDARMRHAAIACAGAAASVWASG